MKSKNYGYLLIVFLLVLSCSKKSVEDTSNNGNVPSNSNPKFIKLYNGRFAVKSDGSLWGWGGETGYADGYKTPKKMLEGGIKDFQGGYVAKEDGTLWQMGKFNTLNYFVGCGPYKGQTFASKMVNNYIYTQLSSDANWIKVGVKNNGFIYNVIEQPVFTYSWWDQNECKGWWRDLNYWGTFWKIPSTYNDWKYTNLTGNIGLRSNGVLYKIAETNSYLGQQYNQTTYPEIFTEIDKNVSEISMNNGGLLYKKNDGTFWCLDNNYIPTQISGVWKSITGTYISSSVQRFIGVKVDGTLWAWGFNSDGFLGDGSYTDQVSPIKISDKTNWLQVSTENALVGSFTALDSDGNIYGWGKNDKGQLGDGTTTDKYKPTLVIRSN